MPGAPQAPSGMWGFDTVRPESGLDLPEEERLC